MSKRLFYRSPSAGFFSDLLVGEFPAWLRALRGKSGVYVIRDAETRAVLYVGGSHSGKLYETLTRHFQRWSGPTAGPTYGRGLVQVAIIIKSGKSAVAEQNRLICKLKPRDNEQSPGCTLRRSDDPF